MYFSKQEWGEANFEAILIVDEADLNNVSVIEAVKLAAECIQNDEGDTIIPVPCEPGMAPAKLFYDRVAVLGLKNSRDCYSAIAA